MVIRESGNFFAGEKQTFTSLGVIFSFPLVSTGSTKIATARMKRRESVECCRKPPMEAHGGLHVGGAPFLGVNLEDVENVQVCNLCA